MTLTGVAARAIRGEPIAAALAAFLDAFFGADPEERQTMIGDVPSPLGDARRDVRVGAAGQDLALLWGLEVPCWTRDPVRFPGADRAPVAFGAPTPGSDPGLVPPAFARRRVAGRGEPLMGDRPPPELDGFLLTPVGAPPGRPDLRLHARRGAYRQGADPAYASVVVTVPRPGGIGRRYALVSLGPPVRKLLGMPLPSGASAAVAAFVERHRTALLGHWAGATDSIGPMRALDDEAGVG